jgi:hypothetical protein
VKRFALRVMLAMVAFSPTPSNATTMVMLRSQTEVVLAADSAGTFRYFGINVILPTCKMYKIGDRFFGIAGLVNNRHFNAADIVTQEIANNYDLMDAMVSIEHRITSDLLADLPMLQVSDPETFTRLTSKVGNVTVMIIAMEGSVPIAISLKIEPRVLSDGTFTATASHDRCPGDCLGGVKASWTGQTELIVQALHDGRFKHSSPTDLARSLVQVEIDGHARGVDGPVDLIRLRANEPPWISTKDGCPVSVAK